MLQKSVSRILVCSLLLVGFMLIPGAAHSRRIDQPATLISTTCEACKVDGGFLVQYIHCVSQAGSGQGGCSIAEDAFGCIFSEDSCTDVYGGGGPIPTEVDHIDSYGELGSAEADTVIARFRS